MKYKTLLASVLALGGVASANAAAGIGGSILNDLVVHLKFDGDYANTAPGSSVAATAAGSPTIEAGRIGSGAVHVITAKGSSVYNYVTLGTPSELNFADTTDFTISYWAKLNSFSGDPSFLSNKNWDDGGKPGWVIATDSGGAIQWNFTEDNNGRADYDGPTIYGNGGWHHVVVVFDREGKASTYADGVLINASAIGPAVGSIDSAALPTNIGQDGTGTYGSDIDALIDDVAIWRRALDAADVAGIYRAGTNGQSVLEVTDPEHPVLLTVSPVAGEVDVRTDRAIVAVIRDGLTPLSAATVQLTINGTPASVTQDKAGIYTTITHQPAAPLANKTVYTARLVYGDAGLLATNTWQFTTVGAEQASGITGHWDFDGDLSAVIGKPLEYMGGVGGPTAALVQFGSTTSFGIPDINGVPAKVMRFQGPTSGRPEVGLIMTHGAVPNGTPTATMVNQWTLIFDVLMGDTNKWFSFIQTDANGDGDLFKNPGGGIGISGNYQGAMVPMQWHRVAFALDLTGDAPVISKFIDGVKVSDQTRTAPQVDARHSLRATAQLFQDNDGESQLAYVNSIQFRNYKMRDHEIAALGGPDASGIPIVSGQWDFNEGAVFADGLKSTIGRDLQYLPGTEFNTIYQTVTIGGETANVLSYTAGAETDGYWVPHGGLPNGGGQRVNQYSLIMDVYYPASSTGYRALWQTDTNFPAANDGDLFVNGDNGIGISQYHGSVTPDEWHRLAFTFDLTKRELGKYIDGTNVLSAPAGSPPLGTGLFQYLSASSGIVDGRWSLSPLASLLADEDGEVAPVLVNSVQFRPVTISADDVRRLGKPTAAGIPVQIPADLQVQSLTRNTFTYTLQWSGGKPPYQVQFKTRLSAGWEDYKLPTNDRTIEIELIDIDGDNAFFRVVGQ